MDEDTEHFTIGVDKHVNNNRKWWLLENEN